MSTPRAHGILFKNFENVKNAACQAPKDWYCVEHAYLELGYRAKVQEAAAIA